MANPVLEAVARDIDKISEEIQEAKDLISALREAGEQTADLEAEINNMEIRKTKWERMLKSRGVL